eukprot:gnl/MRDRNA2_/MRDRNA2_167754_c0_seq1.p1 gnl/MRDRNA2_/MRDRNA2_167754_c0~~gnl/MRDRNA2_/MRDRNA2_167754_c0_seq1.p1  ORF type:complete len:257 (+),score=44.27 gnl/MRDRNA2_/MRDRNA2_167754_c0_seq1:86-772(+)
MSGDITGAMILLAVSRLKDRQSGSDLDCYMFRFLRAPYHISLLLLGWAACHLCLASPIFAVAVAAQVIMGTLCVFTYQFLVEMMQLYAGGDLKIYLRLQCLSGFSFAAGVSAGTAFSTWAYVTFGRKVPFLIASAVAFIGFAVYTVGFLTRVGVPRSLKDFEEEHTALPSIQKPAEQKKSQEKEAPLHERQGSQTREVPHQEQQETSKKESLCMEQNQVQIDEKWVAL